MTHEAPTGVLHDQSFCSLVYQLFPTKSQPLSRFFLYGAWAAWSQLFFVLLLLLLLFCSNIFISVLLLFIYLSASSALWIKDGGSLVFLLIAQLPIFASIQIDWSTFPTPPPPHPEQRTNQHHVVIAPRRSSSKFGEAKMFFFCISIDRTTKWSLQMEIIVHFLCLLSGLHLFYGSPLTIVGQSKCQSS